MKQTEIVRAEKFNRETLTDHSFSFMNIHGALSVGGALLVVAVLLLACLVYGVARYRDYVKRMRHRAATSLEILKPSCRPETIERAGTQDGDTYGGTLTR